MFNRITRSCHPSVYQCAAWLEGVLRLFGAIVFISATFVLGIAGTCVALDETANATTIDLRTGLLDQLKDRQLHRLAEVHCRRQLERVDLLTVERARFIDELLRSIAMQAIASNPEQRSELWGRLDKTADELRETTTGLPLAQLDTTRQAIRVFHARALLASAFNARSPGELKQESQLLFRRAGQELRRLETTLAEQYRGAKTNAEKRAFKTLRLEVQYQRAECYLRSAALYAAKSPDHIAALSSAADQFSKVARIRPESQLTSVSRIHHAEALRRLRSFDDAKRLLRTLQDSSEDATTQLLVEAELAAIEIDSGSAITGVERLARAANQMKDAHQSAFAKARFTLIFGYAKLASESSSNNDGKTWRSLAVDQLRQLEMNHEAVWVRRAEALLTSASPGKESSDLELMKRTAANLYRRQEFDRAVVSYQRAAELANELGLVDEAFDLRFKAAAVLHTRKQFDRSFEAFRELSEQAANHPRAAAAHWLAVQAAANIARSSTSQIEVYETTLATHIATWPQAPTSNQGRVWLARLRRQKREFDQAVELLGQVTSSHQAYSTVLRELRLTYYAWIDSSTDPTRTAKFAAAHFARLLSDSQLIARESASDDRPLTCSAALGIVEFGLLFTAAAPTLYETTIEANDLVNDCRRLAPSLAFALEGLGAALQNDTATAQEAWKQVKWTQQPWVIPLVARIDRQLSAAPSYRLASLQRNLIEAIQAVDAYKSSTELRSYAASALIHAGRAQEATTELEQLVAEAPRDIPLQIALAKAYKLDASPEAISKSLMCWRRVARLSQPETPDWYRAKLEIARMLIATGERRRAAESIRVMQALHPELGGAEFKRDFEAILQETRAEP